MTRFEKVQKMNPIELAEFLRRFKIPCKHCRYLEKGENWTGCNSMDVTDCDNRIKDWLLESEED